MTNLIAPARLPIYLGLGERFDTLVAIGKPEPNRAEWPDLRSRLSDAGVRVEVAWGQVFRIAEDRFLHVNPGYLRILWREDPDAVISIELGFRTLVAYLYTRLKGKPLWIWWAGTPHSERELQWVKQGFRRYLAAKDVRWISYGQESTRYLELLGVRTDRIVQIQNTVDERLFASVGETAPVGTDRPLVLVVGQLVERKGIEPLLESARRLVDQSLLFHLRIVGSGPRLERLQAMAQALGLDNVEFVGGLSPDCLPAYYRSADVVVFPTLEDVWGLVTNEALLCGTPVLCSRYAGSASELLDSEDVFDPLDPSDFDRALTRAARGLVKLPTCDRIWPIERVTRVLVVDVEGEILKRSAASGAA